MKVKTVYTEIINRCNFNCKTCYNRSGINTDTELITAAQYEKIVETFKTYETNRFLLSGGEPSLHPDFDAFIDFIRNHPELSFGVVTNVTSRNQNFIDALNTLPSFTLQVSLDGASDETNSLTRGKGNFAKAVEFVSMIHNDNTKPLLKMVVSKFNLHEVEDFYRMAVDLNCIPEYAFIYRSGNAESDWNNKVLTAQEKLKVLKTVDKLNKEYNISAFLPLCTVSCPFTRTADEMSACIKVDGSIQPCQTLYSSEFTLANIFDFDRAVFERNVDDLISLAQKRQNTDFSCSKCILHSYCGKGCMAAAVNLSGDPLQNDGDCDYRKLVFFGYQFQNFKERDQK